MSVHRAARKHVCTRQDRAVALHHVDVPWRPADLEQREGRLIRQGNQNPEVEICNYVTKATFDTVMWTVERKARFIAQIKTGDLDARTAEDIGSDELAMPPRPPRPSPPVIRGTYSRCNSTGLSPRRAWGTFCHLCTHLRVHLGV